MVQYLKVGILSMNAEDNYLLHRVALHACRINLHAYGDTLHACRINLHAYGDTLHACRINLHAYGDTLHACRINLHAYGDTLHACVVGKRHSKSNTKKIPCHQSDKGLHY